MGGGGRGGGNEAAKGGRGKGAQDGGKMNGWSSGGTQSSSWTPAPMTTGAEPSDNLYIKGLPLEFTEEQMQSIFSGFGVISQCKIMHYTTDSCALVRMGSVEMAIWMVENLNGNIPEGLSRPISIRFADSPTTKAKKMQGQFAGLHEGDGGFGKAVGKSIGKSSPYGQDGKSHRHVQCGNLDPQLPEDLQAAVNSVLTNLGGKGRKRIAHEGDASNLYVKDLPATTDDLYIYKLFSPFGPLESVVVKKGPDGSWAIAFVKYFTNEAAAKAMLGLTNCLLPDGTMPKITIKTKK